MRKWGTWALELEYLLRLHRHYYPPRLFDRIFGRLEVEVESSALVETFRKYYPRNGQ